MTDRRLATLAFVVFLLVGAVSGGGTFALLSDSETVTTELSVDVPEAGNVATETGRPAAAAGNVEAPTPGATGNSDTGPAGGDGGAEEDAQERKPDSPGNSERAGPPGGVPSAAGNVAADAAGNAPEPPAHEGGNSPEQVERPERAARPATARRA